MPNILTLTFNAPSIADTSVQFNVSVSGVAQIKKETFKEARSSSGEASIGATPNEQAMLYVNAFNADFSADNLVATRVDNVVTISNTLGLNIYGVLVPSNVSYTLQSTSINVTGLNGDRYLINNPILISVGSGVYLDYFKINLTNLYNGKTSSDIIVYPDLSGRAQINIGAHIKGLFAMPADAVQGISSIVDIPTANANVFEITVSSPSSPDTESVTLTKCFIRGGKRTNGTNQTLLNNSVARPQLKLPIWEGYPASAYVVVGQQVMKRPMNNVPDSQKDYRRSKGCNETYVRFSNQQGGYSEWLFESHEDSESNNALGTFYQGFKLSSLGSESTFTKKLFGKVPGEYINLIKDLIESPEVYYFTSNRTMEMCTVSKNTITSDQKKTGYFVTITLTIENQFNASLLWSN